jgi:hypothetical protein
MAQKPQVLNTLMRQRPIPIMPRLYRLATVFMLCNLRLKRRRAPGCVRLLSR